jgi:hypothetical protein
MPNAAIPSSVRQTLTANAFRLAERITAYSLMNFPIAEPAELERIINDPHLVTLQRTLHDRGVEQTRTDDLNVLLHRDQIPNLKRGMILRLSNLPTPIFVPRSGVRGSVWRFDWDNPTTQQAYVFQLNLEDYSTEQLDALGTWANTVVFNKRRETLVQQVVNSTLNERHTRTVGHLHAWWPALSGLYMREDDKLWHDRMQNPPRRNLQIYAPKDSDATVHANYAKHREIAEQVFTMGRMLPPFAHPSGRMRAAIMKIEKLEGDKYIEG